MRRLDLTQDDFPYQDEADLPELLLDECDIDSDDDLPELIDMDGVDATSELGYMDDVDAMPAWHYSPVSPTFIGPTMQFDLRGLNVPIPNSPVGVGIPMTDRYTHVSGTMSHLSIAELESIMVQEMVDRGVELLREALLHVQSNADMDDIDS